MKLSKDELPALVIVAVQAKIFVNFALRILLLLRVDRLVGRPEKLSSQYKLVMSLACAAPRFSLNGAPPISNKELQGVHRVFATESCAGKRAETKRMSKASFRISLPQPANCRASIALGEFLFSRCPCIRGRVWSPQSGGQLAGHIRLNLCHRSVNEYRLRIAPLNSPGIERSHVPENPFVTATAWLKTRELSVHLLRNQVVLVPELFDPRV
jgi:hypothetical protein